MPKGIPTDWTNGTGTFPAGGLIQIPANPNRQWLLVQNRDIGTVTVLHNVDDSNMPAGATAAATLVLGAASVSGGMGGSDERSLATYVPEGAVTIAGTAGQQVTVLEG